MTTTTNTTARAALALLTEEESIDMIRACYYHAMRLADTYHLDRALFEAVGEEEAVSAAYIERAALLDRLDRLPDDDDRRNWPLVKITVRAVCRAVRKTYRAEHGTPSALVYLDALPDGETRAAVIDTAARAIGRAPETPEAAYIERETVADILAASCASDTERAALRATAAGLTAQETAARLGTTRAAVENALRRARARAKAAQTVARLEAWEKPLAADFIADAPTPTPDEAETVTAWISAARKARRA